MSMEKREEDPARRERGDKMEKEDSDGSEQSVGVGLSKAGQSHGFFLWRLMTIRVFISNLSFYLFIIIIVTFY